MPPAVTTTRAAGEVRAWPVGVARVRGRGVGEDPLAHGIDLLRLGQPAGAGVGAGEAPGRRREDVHAASARVATLAWVAGCSHISVCIAGASTTGQRAVSRVLVSRSSASPCGGLGEQVGGRRGDDDEVGLLPSRTCGTSWTSSQTSVCTGLPDSASQVGAPTNCSADAVGTTRDVVARLGEQPQQRAGLVGGDAAADAEDDAAAHRRRLGQLSPRSGSEVTRPALISRSAIDSGFSWTWVSTSGPTYSSRPSWSWE